MFLILTKVSKAITNYSLFSLSANPLAFKIVCTYGKGLNSRMAIKE